jgi:DNA helicase-2/ATP-dependent DNA helicase PcrA
LEDRNELEEERRLFYVGLTRAKERVLCWAANRRRRGRGFLENGISRFLGEIPPDLLQVHDGSADGVDPAAHASDGALEGLKRAGGDGAADWPGVGDRVFHGSFGWGVVVDREPGAVPRCTVAFGSFGRKRIVSSYLRRAED